MQDREHMVPHRETDTEIPQEALDREHEQRDLGVGWLVASLVLLFVLTAATIGAMALLFDFFEARQLARDPRPAPLVESPAAPPEPRLENTTGEVLEALRTNEEVLLDTYAWVDREAGLVRIPVDRAIDILAERGLPWRGASAQSDTATDSDRAPERQQR